MALAFMLIGGTVVGGIALANRATAAADVSGSTSGPTAELTQPVDDPAAATEVATTTTTVVTATAAERPVGSTGVHNACVSQILLFAGIASAALVVGALIGIRWVPPAPVLAAILAFAGGALTAALAFELFEESFRRGSLISSSLGLVAGAAAFVGIDVVLERRVRGRGGDVAGHALLAVVVLDGVPENLALGTTLAVGTGSLPLLAAIFASNLPESLVGARSMRDEGRSARFALATWSVAAVVLAGAIVIGALLLENLGGTTKSVILAFAGGAVLASLADTVFPRAFKDGGPFVAFATVVGFLTAFALGSVQA
jgi:ZIP family zinc transporter